MVSDITINEAAYKWVLNGLTMKIVVIDMIFFGNKSHICIFLHHFENYETTFQVKFENIRIF
jgi:hypothetical protein